MEQVVSPALPVGSVQAVPAGLHFLCLVVGPLGGLPARRLRCTSRPGGGQPLAAGGQPLPAWPFCSRRRRSCAPSATARGACCSATCRPCGEHSGVDGCCLGMPGWWRCCPACRLLMSCCLRLRCRLLCVAVLQSVASLLSLWRDGPLLPCHLECYHATSCARRMQAQCGGVCAVQQCHV